MTGSTVPDGFITESTDDLPGVSLNGGLDGSGTKLPEQIQTKFIATDAAITDLMDRVAALESGSGGIGWIPIGSGTASGATFSIDLTDGGRFPNPPLWDEVRVSMRVDMSGSDDEVRCRVNNDSDLVYRSGSFTMDSQVPAVSDADNWHYPTASQSAWAIAKLGTISTNLIDLRIFHTGVSSSLLAFQAFSSRQSDSSSTHRNWMASGSLTSGKTATSLTFLAPASTFSTVYWWAEGLRMVAP
ncbi:hypothetical protein [Glycomyces sp. NPDC021274]|uniref:hypothetical protein n=1 Tax=Glycomyces sp. NPDC021274 TaxID=3155120 RepID=UPI0033C6532F